jgi:hypothetical protein
MTIFKNIKDGKFYAILYKSVSGKKVYTAVPYGHTDKTISNCDLSEFVIETIKYGGRGSFL